MATRFGAVRPSLAHPGGKRGRKQRRIDPVHQQVQPAPAGNAVMKGQIAAKERQVLFPPSGDAVEVVAIGHRAADDQQKHLRQRMGHPPGFARIIDDEK